MNYFDLTGNVALVTGCSTGLGVQMARALANQGADIICLARRKNLVDEVAEQIRKDFGVKAIGISCDITNRHNYWIVSCWCCQCPRNFQSSCRTSYITCKI